jgi:polysaccharide pyruvyl transferase CsaB
MTKMLKGKKHVVLSGYYGFDNCGDEAVLLAIIKSLRKLRPDISITVFSGNPAKTTADYEVAAVSRNKLLPVMRSLLGADLMISGGGSLLQDETSARSPLYYLGVLKLAQWLAKKTMVYAQGIGPLRIEKNRKRVVQVFNKCQAITVRDQDSAEDLAAMGLKKPVTVVADPVLTLQPKDIISEPGCRILQELGLADQQGKKVKPLLVVALRNWKEQNYFTKVAAALDEVVAAGWNVLMVPLHFPQDVKAIQGVAREMGQRCYCFGEKIGPQELLSVIKQADLVLAMRLHGLIMAMAAEVPMAALSYDPKVDRFMKQTGLDTCLPLDSFTAEELQRVMGRLIIEKDQLKPMLAKRRKQLYENAWAAARLADKLLDK